MLCFHPTQYAESIKKSYFIGRKKPKLHFYMLKCHFGHTSHSKGMKKSFTLEDFLSEKDAFLPITANFGGFYLFFCVTGPFIAFFYLNPLTFC